MESQTPKTDYWLPLTPLTTRKTDNICISMATALFFLAPDTFILGTVEHVTAVAHGGRHWNIIYLLHVPSDSLGSLNMRGNLVVLLPSSGY